MAINLTPTNFEQETQNGLVMVDFWGDWCQPCKMLDPVLEQLEKEFGDKIKFAKVNVQENMELAQKWGIQNIPAQVLFIDGQAKEKVTGYKPKDQFEKYLTQKISEYNKSDQNE
ncbi:thioredoxin [Ligilactobacillus cholophilus]|uniref:thioredoxin n=1 Tax=Ligilactobacillus cholophilus TaxID=3050131 RepID=UPI0025B1A093|nr:thioredoxin [Ligilactobacillus cholophilus]